MAKELHDFSFGFAESIRYILHYTKQEFKDVKHDFSIWDNQKTKESLPYGKLPIYKEGNRILHQSLVIAKYVARGTSLIPVDLWDQALLENIVHTIYDVWCLVHAFMLESDPNKKREIKKKLLEETMDFFFSRFEQHLKENGGYFNGKLTWADFIFCGLVETTDLILGIELEQKYPMVKALIEKIKNLPGVKEYIASRGPYKLPTTLQS